ncbi:hypothetical protein HZS_7332 [Henneguya salminicola]|nr:hypothetical protein HZS_7332 [Henneguya salminicola]
MLKTKNSNVKCCGDMEDSQGCEYHIIFYYNNRIMLDSHLSSTKENKNYSVELFFRTADDEVFRENGNFYAELFKKSSNRIYDKIFLHQINIPPNTEGIDFILIGEYSNTLMEINIKFECNGNLGDNCQFGCPKYLKKTGFEFKPGKLFCKNGEIEPLNGKNSKTFSNCFRTWKFVQSKTM